MEQYPMLAVFLGNLYNYHTSIRGWIHHNKVKTICKKILTVTSLADNYKISKILILSQTWALMTGNKDISNLWTDSRTQYNKIDNF